MSIVNIFRGTRGLSKPPIDDIDSYWTPMEKAQTGQWLERSIYGSRATVTAGIEALVEETGADELMIVSRCVRPRKAAPLVRTDCRGGRQHRCKERGRRRMTTQPFTLHPRLAADTAAIIDLPLSTLRLMRDANYAWVILIPRQVDLTELTDLGRDDRIRLMDEITTVSDALKAETGCLKLNVAAIGNIVRQLHIHVIARNEGDAAWPGPVWGKHPAALYAPEAEAALIQRLAARLG